MSIISKSRTSTRAFARWPRVFTPHFRQVRRWIGTRLPGAKFHEWHSGSCRCVMCWAPDAVLDFQLAEPRIWCAACGFFGLLRDQLEECGWPTGPLASKGAL